MPLTEATASDIHATVFAVRELETHPAERAARDYREHTVVGLPDGGGNPLWQELCEAHQENERLKTNNACWELFATSVARMPQPGPDGEVCGCGTEPFVDGLLCHTCEALYMLSLRGTPNVAADSLEQIPAGYRRVQELEAAVAELRSQLATAAADRDVFRGELMRLNRQFVEAMTPDQS